MIIGAVKENFPGEGRVAIVPDVIPLYVKAGHEVRVQSGAGEAAGFPDAAYVERNAAIVPDRGTLFREADVVLQVRGYGANPEQGRGDLELVRQGQVVIATFEPLTAHEPVREMAARGVTLFAMELIPRITRAQSMDVLSSMATIAGYKAVLLAAERLPKIFPMLMTAAGTLPPARVLVVGAGVAGLQAIATARRLGATVEAYDVRAAVKEQVLSLGAKFVEMELEAGDAEDRGGYAREMGEDFYRKQRELMTRVLADVDVAITTAAVPGKTAPVLITGEMVRHMRSGSLIVDLAAERGGNCELTRAGETVVEHGVAILGPVNLPASVPHDASRMYARNLVTLIQHLTEDGQLTLDTEDEIVRETMVTRDGEVTQTRVREVLGLAGAAS